jgi:hypothetical protein
MAKAKKRKYSRSSGSDVKNEMQRYKKDTAKSGRGGKGGRVTDRSLGGDVVSYAPKKLETTGHK